MILPLEPAEVDIRIKEHRATLTWTLVRSKTGETKLHIGAINRSGVLRKPLLFTLNWL